MVRSPPSFSFPVPASGEYESAKRLAAQYGFLCQEYDNYGENCVGLWERFDPPTPNTRNYT
jgi:hypothetical protein